MIDFLNYVINGFLQGQIYALLALGFMVIYRASKVFNFAQGELMMLGAYAVWTLTIGANIPTWLAIPLAFVCAIVYGWLIERLFFERLVGESVFSMVMVTIGLVILIRGMGRRGSLISCSTAPRSLHCGRHDFSFLPGHWRLYNAGDHDWHVLVF